MVCMQVEHPRGCVHFSMEQEINYFFLYVGFVLGSTGGLINATEEEI